jgi:endonuclease YncB( thermonuclease family)
MIKTISIGFLLLCASSVYAAALEGRVVKVADGDTITLLDASRVQHKIRISGIDAPERKQPFGAASKKNMSDLSAGKQAEAICYKRDRYKRLICTVYVNGEDVALAQLDAGLAWWYRKYAKEQPPSLRREYDAAETRAAADRVGLWQDENPMPPWKWRRSGGQENAPAGCVIKGNISRSGERIYHVPGGRYYSATKINESKGERWFCSEEKARSAGWRASKR